MFIVFSKHIAAQRFSTLAMIRNVFLSTKKHYNIAKSCSFSPHILSLFLLIFMLSCRPSSNVISHHPLSVKFIHLKVFIALKVKQALKDTFLKGFA